MKASSDQESQSADTKPSQDAELKATNEDGHDSKMIDELNTHNASAFSDRKLSFSMLETDNVSVSNPSYYDSVVDNVELSEQTRPNSIEVKDDTVHDEKPHDLPVINQEVVADECLNLSTVNILESSTNNCLREAENKEKPIKLSSLNTNINEDSKNTQNSSLLSQKDGSDPPPYISSAVPILDSSQTVSVPSEEVKEYPSELVVANYEKKELPAPIVCSAAKLEMSSNPVKTQNGIQLSGIKYTSNILSVPKCKVKTPMQISSMTLNDSSKIGIGTNVDAQGNMTVNQYVQLGPYAISPDSKLTVTDSSNDSGRSWCSKKKHLWAMVVLGLVLTTTLTAAAFLFMESTSASAEVTVPDPGADAPANYTQRLIPRSQWSVNSKEKPDDLPFKPARFVIVSHTAGAFCDTPVTCQNIVRSVESWHKQIGIGIVGYNFLIGGDGYIYEGRGWDKYGAHTRLFNCASVGVSFVGNFEKDKLAPSMIEAFEILIEEGLRRGALSENYKLWTHNQVKETASPGLNVIPLVKTWKNWGPVNKEDDLCAVKN